MVVEQRRLLMPDYNHFLRMAQHMKASSNDIVAAIEKVQAADYGVVALVFTKGGRKMEIQILDEPFGPNVRLFPGV